MPLSVDDVINRHEELVTKRQHEEPQWREIATLLKPEDRDIGSKSSRDRVADDIFDSTPLYALDTFEGGLFTQATNPADRWFEFGLVDKDLQAWGPVKQYLWNYATLTFASFGPGVSPYYAMVPASFGDLGAFGFGTMYSDMKPNGREFTDLAIPLSESYIDTDGAGRVTTFDREWRASGLQLQRLFGDPARMLTDKRYYYCIHSVFENPDFSAGKIGNQGKNLSSIYVIREEKNFRVEGGFYEMPYHSAPWRLRSGRVWPIGPGHIARADTNMLNEMERSHIVAAQFDAEPPILAHDESVLSAADLQPNQFLYGALNESGDQLLQRFDRGSELKLSIEQSQQRRAAIREAFLFSIMQVVNRPQMTASEFLGWKEEQLRLMGPNLGRIHHFMLAPLIKRRVRLLQRGGFVPPPPPELKGQNIEIEFISPLAKAQKVATGRAATQFVGACIQVKAANPESAIMDDVDEDAYATVMADSLGAPPQVRRSPDDVAKIRQQRAQEQQQQLMLQKAQAAAAAYADVAHANQAQTRAAGRVGGPGQQGQQGQQ